MRDPLAGTPEDFRDGRVGAGVLLAPAGPGGDASTADAAARYPFFEVDFEVMRTPAFIVAGDRDELPFPLLGLPGRRRPIT